MKKSEKPGKKSGEIADEKLDKVSGGGLASEYSVSLNLGATNTTLNQPSVKVPPKRILVP